MTLKSLAGALGIRPGFRGGMPYLVRYVSVLSPYESSVYSRFHMEPLGVNELMYRKCMNCNATWAAIFLIQIRKLKYDYCMKLLNAE